MPTPEVIDGRFEIEAEAARGAAGCLYRARDLQTGRRVAIKRVDLSRSLHRLEREARALCRVGAPGVVGYVAHSVTRDGGYLALEWLDGEDLERRLRRGRLAVSEAMALVGAVASTMDAVHRAGVVHRDLKPANLFLPAGAVDGVRVLDFGVARLPGDGPERPGVVMGTPATMAPEQVRGDVEVDARADVFSLGCVLYRLLTGTEPFAASNALATMARVVLDDPPPLSELRPGLPTELEEVSTSMLDKDPARRPSALAVAEALGGLRSRPAVRSGPPDELLALTSGEVSLRTVVLATTALPGDPPPDRGSPAPAADALGDLPTGVHVLALPHGSLIATASEGEAGDAAAAAARVALTLGRQRPEMMIVLATSRVPAGRRAIGPVVDHAVSLLPVERGRVRVDDVTAALLPTRFEVRPTADGAILVGEGATVAPPRWVGDGPTPMFGRQTELGTLRSAVDAALFSDGGATGVVVTGGPGMGKSRLRHELVSTLGAVEVWTARGDATRTGSAFALMAELLRDGLALHQGGAEALARRLAQLGLAEDGSSLARDLGRLVGEGESATPPTLRDRQTAGDRVRVAWLDIADAATRKGPLMLVVEDLHWADRPSVELLGRALERLADRHLLVLALARPEVDDLFPDLWAEQPPWRVTLGPLASRDAIRLVTAGLGRGAPAELVHDIVARADGNPFFLEELVRARVDGSDAELPATLEATLQARLRALAAPSRRVLRAASIFGERASMSGVQALLGGREAQDVERSIDTLREQRLLAEGSSRFAGEPEILFVHGLVRAAAYGMLTAEDRRLGHTLAARWLISRGESDGAVLAGHLHAGGRGLEAAPWWRRAAEQAFEGNDLDAVTEHASRGLEAATDPRLRAALLSLRAAASFWRGDLTCAADEAVAAMDLAEPGRRVWCEALHVAATSLQRLGAADRLPALVARALEASPDHESAGDLAYGRILLASACRHLGDEATARAVLAVVDARMPDDPHAIAARSYLRAVEAKRRGDLGAYLDATRVSHRASVEAGILRRALNHAVNIGYAQIGVGRNEDAARTLRRAVTDADRLGLPALVAFARHNLGLALARLGQLEEAEEVEQAAVDAAARGSDQHLEGASRMYLARILSSRGEHGRALEEALAAEGILAEASPPLLPPTVAVIARILLQRGRTAEALAEAKRAAELAAKSIDEGLVEVMSTLAEALHAAGEQAEARAVIAAERDRVLANAAQISDPDLRRSFLHGEPDHARVLALCAAWGA